MKLRTREKFQFGGRNNLALLAAKRYTIAAGASTTVTLSLGTKALLLVQKRPAARRIWIQVSVLDSAGNRAVLSKKGKVLLPLNVWHRVTAASYDRRRSSPSARADAGLACRSAASWDPAVRPEGATR